MSDDEKIEVLQESPPRSPLRKKTRSASPHARCPLCGLQMPRDQVQEHTNICLDEHAALEDIVMVEDGAAAGPSGPRNVNPPAPGRPRPPPGPSSSAPEEAPCPRCGEIMGLDLLDDHLAAHALADDDAPGPAGGGGAAGAAAAAAVGGPGPLGGGAGAAPIVRNFGRCYTCGKAGHWSTECPTVPRPPPQPDLPLNPAQLAAAQQIARPPNSPLSADLTPLLRARLDSELRGGRGGLQPGQCALIVGGHVEHYATEAAARGFGCGYSNLAMMAAHLAARSPTVAAALFGGRGVPDIRAMQAWIEVAWSDGFDPPGRAHFGGRLQGGRDWIGTTEAAAALRYMGVDARVVDFEVVDRAKKESANAYLADVAASAASERAGHEVHPGVQCDNCGATPIKGPRFKSRCVQDYDLCSGCRSQPQADAMGPYERVMAGGMLGVGGGGRVRTPKTKCGLEEWVWAYFEQGLPGGGGAPTGPPLSGVRLSDRTPLYFQHQGHSRTIVGITRTPSPSPPTYKYQLVILDPSHPTNKVLGLLRGTEPGDWARLLRVPSMAIAKKDQYQVLYCHVARPAAGGGDAAAQAAHAQAQPLMLSAAARAAARTVAAEELVDITP